MKKLFYVNPRLRYEFTRDIALEGSYNFTFTKYKAVGYRMPRRSLVMLRLYMQYPLFE